MNPAEDESGVIELERGITLFPGRKEGGCNVYLLRGTQKTLLIDLGLPGDYDYICAGLSRLGLTIDDVSMLLLTHEHVDHVGALNRLPRRVVVGAHKRAATKFSLDDRFSMMSGAFNVSDTAFHVDLYLDDGALIDLGGLKLRVIYTPGHCSGSVCFYESIRGILFSGDTVFGGGVLGGIFASGNISDYIESLERLLEFNLVALYPGHGRMSSTPKQDILRAIAGSRQLMSDTQGLFDSIDIRKAFSSIKHSTADYARRAVERRHSRRIRSGLGAVVHLQDADYPVKAINLSMRGLKLDRILEVEKGKTVDVTLEKFGRFSCVALESGEGHTRMKFVGPQEALASLHEWMIGNKR